MNTLRTELNRLRWPLLRLCLALFISLAACSVAWHFMQMAQRKADTAELSAATMLAEALRLQNEEREMHAKIAKFQTINARGIIGPERRLDWVELIRGIEYERKLLGLEYEVQPQTSLANTDASGGYAFKSSTMRVQIPLLHEDDLLNFMADLRTHAAAFTRVRSCKLQRGTQNPDTNGTPPQILAECQIEWITLQDIDAAEGSKP